MILGNVSTQNFSIREVNNGETVRRHLQGFPQTTEIADSQEKKYFLQGELFYFYYALFSLHQYSNAGNCN
jgi:hypothetical protein